MVDATEFDAISFDVYGTILNWEPEIARFLGDWAASQGLDLDTAELLLSYDRLRQPLQDIRPALRYPEVLRQSLQRIADEYGGSLQPETLDRFGDIAATHEPFADSVSALNDLRAMGFQLAALSNIDDDSFARVTAACGIGFDVVVTAQRVGAYKPDPAHFWAALADLEALGIPMERVLHVAQSKRADITVANAIGLTCVWVNRPGHVFGRAGRGSEDARPDAEVASLAGLVRLLKREGEAGVR